MTVELQPNGDNPGRIGFVKLNRPDKLNALTVEMGEEFTTVPNLLLDCARSLTENFDR